MICAPLVPRTDAVSAHSTVLSWTQRATPRASAAARSPRRRRWHQKTRRRRLPCPGTWSSWQWERAWQRLLPPLAPASFVTTRASADASRPRRSAGEGLPVAVSRDPDAPRRVVRLRPRTGPHQMARAPRSTRPARSGRASEPRRPRRCWCALRRACFRSSRAPPAARPKLLRRRGALRHLSMSPRPSTAAMNTRCSAAWCVLPIRSQHRVLPLFRILGRCHDCRCGRRRAAARLARARQRWRCLPPPRPRCRRRRRARCRCLRRRPRCAMPPRRGAPRCRRRREAPRRGLRTHLRQRRPRRRYAAPRPLRRAAPAKGARRRERLVRRPLHAAGRWAGRRRHRGAAPPQARRCHFPARRG